MIRPGTNSNYYSTKLAGNFFKLLFLHVQHYGVHATVLTVLDAVEDAVEAFFEMHLAEAFAGAPWLLNPAARPDEHVVDPDF